MWKLVIVLWAAVICIEASKSCNFTNRRFAKQVLKNFTKHNDRTIRNINITLQNITNIVDEVENKVISLNGSKCNCIKQSTRIIKSYIDEILTEPLDDLTKSNAQIYDAYASCEKLIQLIPRKSKSPRKKYSDEACSCFQKFTTDHADFKNLARIAQTIFDFAVKKFENNVLSIYHAKLKKYTHR